MKNMKKAVSILLVLLMALSMSATVFADEEKGSITNNSASEDNTYTIYKMLDLESYSAVTGPEEGGAYSYKVTDSWREFFTEGYGKDYFTVDAQGYVNWKEGQIDDADTVAALAKEALKYAKENKDEIVAVDEKNGNEDGSPLVFENLDLGYYLIDSTMGALCGLTTTNPNGFVNAKNSAPTIDKQVMEDSTKQWGDSNTADVGQTVEFRTTINVHAGAENYVLHDIMSAGLTFQRVTKIEHVIPETSIKDVPSEYYNVETTGLTDDCTFEVIFTQAFCDHLDTNDKIIVYYEAVVNEKAVIAGEGNPNETWLDFGENHYTTKDKTITKTFRFQIAKTDSNDKLIKGATFKIYDAKVGGNEIKVIKDSANTYRKALAGEVEKGVDIVDIVVDSEAVITINGFDNGTYYLEETVAPEGYNKLAERQKFIISDNNLDVTMNGDIVSTGSGVHVVNKSGTMLPETGGTGTVMFITFGMLVTLAAGVLLVTKRRMSMIDD